MTSFRVHQLNDLIRDSVSQILLLKVNRDFFKLLTVTRVVTAPDLSIARVFVSIPDGKFPQFSEWLKREIFHIQGEFNKSVSLRKLPKLVFVEDTTGDYVDKIDALLRKARRE